MSLKFKCPNCSIELVVQFLKTGETARCYNCGTGVVIPEDAEYVNWESSTIKRIKERNDAINLIKSQPEQKLLKLPWKDTFNYLWSSIKNNWFFFAEIIVIYFIFKIVSMVFEGLSLKAPLTYTVLFVIIFISLDAYINIGIIQCSLKYQTKKYYKHKYLFVNISSYYKYLTAEFIYYFLVGAGLLLFIIPGIIWAVKFQFYGFLIAERDLGPIKALKQSAKLTDNFKAELFPFNFLLVCINFIGRLIRFGHFFTWPLATYALTYVYRWLSKEKGYDVPESSDKVKEVELNYQTERSNSSGQAFPTIFQATILILAMFLITLIIIIPIGVIGSRLNIDFSENIILNAFISLLIFGFIILYGFKRTNKTFSEIFPLKSFSPSLLIPMILSIVGLSILLSEVDNLTRILLPMSESFQKIFEDIFSVPMHAVILAIIIAPITEEALCRGIILNGFLKNYSTRKAIIISACLFGVMHFNPWQFVGAFILGVLFAWLYVHTRSLLPCIIGHAMANSIPLIFLNLGFEISGFSSEYSQEIVFHPWWFDVLGLLLACIGMSTLFFIFRNKKKNNSVNDTAIG